MIKALIDKKAALEREYKEKDKKVEIVIDEVNMWLKITETDVIREEIQTLTKAEV